ncbi:hypothetical protein [Methylobacterium crusticola]|nr:hypothetical protein [Methylobacterium crusticola]
MQPRAGDGITALRDAVIQFDAEGLAGVVDRPHGHRREIPVGSLK